jgi:hypothetical protein
MQMAAQIAHRYCQALKGTPKDKCAFITELVKTEDLASVIDLALIIPLHTALMPKIVPHLVVYLSSQGKTGPGDDLYDKTLSTEAYIELLYARNPSPNDDLVAKMSLPQLIASLKRTRNNMSYMYQLLRNLPPGPLRAYGLEHSRLKLDGGGGSSGALPVQGEVAVLKTATP